VNKLKKVLNNRIANKKTKNMKKERGDK